MRKLRSGTLVLLALAAMPTARADVASIGASKDNTLYESTTGALSNGAGSYFLVGRTGQPMASARRGLIAFNLSPGVPAGSTITSVQLKLNLTQTPAGPVNVELRRLLADWGEGASDAPQGEGGGAPAATGDATWLHRFYPSTFWASPGGAFSATPSAAQVVDANGIYIWSAPRMVTDVQAWLDNPAGNFGWALIGPEGGTTATAKKFDSRNNVAPEAIRPVLIVTYNSGSCVACDTNCDGSSNLFDMEPFVNMLSPSPPPGCSACAGDANNDGSVNLFDIAQFIECLSGP